MFDIGFSELVLLSFVGLVVLGPQRLPIAIKTVMGWVRTLRGLAANVQNELSQELKLQELQESIKKAEHLNLQQLSPELNKTVEELRESAQKIKADLEKKAAETNTSFNEQVKSLKEAVQGETLNNSKVGDDNVVVEEGSQKVSATENLQENTALSPADLAELAEQDEPMTYVSSEYYPDDDTLADAALDTVQNTTKKG